VVTLRCTQRVLKQLRIKPSSSVPQATARLGDWYAGWVARRRPLVMLMNERTLLVVLIPAAPIATLVTRCVAATRDLLLSMAVPDTEVAREIAAMESPVIATTADRRILGCMTEATLILRWLQSREDAPTLRDAEIYFADTMYSTIKYAHPRDLVHDAFGMPRPPRRKLPGSSDTPGVQNP
jgi:hypothetical protein